MRVWREDRGFACACGCEWVRECECEVEFEWEWECGVPGRDVPGVVVVVEEWLWRTWPGKG